MDRREILDYLGSDWTRCCERLNAALDSDIELLNATNASILKHGGKMLRPILSLLVAKTFSPADASLSDDSIHFAAASELLHNATLIHDDVADCSATRHGVPTVMSLLGGTAAVLVGDFWLVRAVDEILAAGASCAEVIRLFSKTLSDLAEGEMLQLQKSESGDTSESDYLRIIYSKTASLFEAACVSAAISVGASAQERDAIRRYAIALGLAFQIKDDILDYVGENIGKPVGQDIRERKITIPLIGALRSAGDVECEHIRRMVCDAAEHEECCEEIVCFVKIHGGLKYAQQRLDDYVAEAKEALTQLPDNRAKDFLVQLAEYSASRNR